MAALLAGLLYDQLERRVLTTRVLELVDALLRDSDHSSPQAQQPGDLRQRGEWLQVARHELVAGRVAVRRRRVPPRSAEQPHGGRVDVELPRREDAHVPPRADCSANVRSRLEHQRLETALEQLGRGCQTDRPRADDRDWKGTVAAHAGLLGRTSKPLDA